LVDSKYFDAPQPNVTALCAYNAPVSSY